MPSWACGADEAATDAIADLYAVTPVSSLDDDVSELSLGHSLTGREWFWANEGTALSILQSAPTAGGEPRIVAAFFALVGKAHELFPFWKYVCQSTVLLFPRKSITSLLFFSAESTAASSPADESDDAFQRLLRELGE